MGCLCCCEALESLTCLAILRRTAGPPSPSHCRGLAVHCCHAGSREVSRCPHEITVGLFIAIPTYTHAPPPHTHAHITHPPSIFGSNADLLSCASLRPHSTGLCHSICTRRNTSCIPEPTKVLESVGSLHQRQLLTWQPRSRTSTCGRSSLQVNPRGTIGCRGVGHDSVRASSFNNGM